MITLQRVYDVLDRVAPFRTAFEGDPVGIQIGDPDGEIRRAVVTFDASLASIEFAARQGAQLLVAHHPMIYHKLAGLGPGDYTSERAWRCASAGLSFIAAHTNWDVAIGGVSEWILRKLGISEVFEIGSGRLEGRYKLVFFVPDDAASRVIDAASAAGAGVIGLYERCAFQTPGLGTFRAREGAHPTIGEVGVVETVAELRVEMVAPAPARRAIDLALRAAHPYEEPALDWIPLEPEQALAVGRFGRLPEPIKMRDLVILADQRLQTRSTAWGDPDRMVQSIASVGGAGDDEWQAAQSAGIDVFVTGEIRQHVALEASEKGMGMIAAGHYATEAPSMEALMGILQKELPSVEWHMFTPPPGRAGRPFA